MTPLPGGRPIRYLATGAICALAHNAVMIAGDLAGGHYVGLSLLSFAVVTPLGYWLHSRFTFGKRLSLRSFARFAAGVAAGFPIALVVMAILCTGLGLPVIVAAPVATVTLFVWNYAIAHLAILGRLGLR